MSSNGLYIHVPFCQKRCLYCDFYSTTYGTAERLRYVESLIEEMHERADYLNHQPLSTIYLGGGTPSQLQPDELKTIFKEIGNIFSLSPDAEVTIEVNPDDVTDTWVACLADLPVNRVSMGVQTFDDNQLSFLHRRHNAQEAITALSRLRHTGIKNISIDLIYGLPNQSLQDWERDIATALNQGAEHLSAYALIFEEGTPLWNMREQGLVAETDENLSLEMYQLLMERLRQAGYEHYEISNFSLPGFRSRHNSGYWSEMHYLGCGPGAHSYNGKMRQWNKPDLLAYLKANGHVIAQSLFELEELSTTTLLNETIMKSLRTADGLDLKHLAERFDAEETKRIIQAVQPYLSQHLLELDEQAQNLRLTKEGIFISDRVMSDLMKV